MYTSEHEVMVETHDGVATPPKRVTTALVFLCCCVGLLMTGFGIIVPVFPQRLQALGLGAETLALMEGAFGLGMFLFSTPMGVLGDRIGRKPIVMISLAGFIATNIVLATVNIPLVFILIRFAEGVLVSGLLPAATAMVGDSVPLERQGRWIGYITTAQATGFALGPGIGGFLYQAWGFASPFFLSAAIALVASLLALIMLPETLPAQIREQGQVRRANKRQGIKDVGNASSATSALLIAFIPLLIVDFCITFVYPFVLPQYPFFFIKVLGYNAAQYGVIVSVYGLSLAVFPMLLGRLSERFSKKLLIILGCLLFSTLNVAMLFLDQYILLILAAMVTGIGSALLIPALGSIYLGATSGHNRSQVMGIRGTAISFGVLLGPLSQAVVSHWITPRTAFAIGAGMAFLAALLVFLVLKNPRSVQHDEGVEASQEIPSPTPVPSALQ